CLTFDDGYRDNLTYAYPILRRHGVPFAIYVPTSFPDRLGDLWWLTLEAVVAATDHILVAIADREWQFTCCRSEEKREVYARLYWLLRGLDREEELRLTIRELAVRYGIDPDGWCA